LALHSFAIKLEIAHPPKSPKPSWMLTSLQLRLARAALQISTRELAAQTGVSAPTITRHENAGNKAKPNATTLIVLRRYFEDHGVVFLNGDGIRLKSPE
jgi:predicted transcriptional regulator